MVYDRSAVTQCRLFELEALRESLSQGLGVLFLSLRGRLRPPGQRSHRPGGGVLPNRVCCPDRALVLLPAAALAAAAVAPAPTTAAALAAAAVAQSAAAVTAAAAAVTAAAVAQSAASVATATITAAAQSAAAVAQSAAAVAQSAAAVAQSAASVAVAAASCGPMRLHGQRKPDQLQQLRPALLSVARGVPRAHQPDLPVW